MAEFIEGIDISVYQKAVDQAHWNALAQSQQVAVVGSAHPRPNEYCEGNLERALATGFKAIATYIVVYPGVPSAQTVDVARRMCGRFWDQLAFAAIDCELDGITESQIFGMETAIKAAGLRPVIYTARWWWRDHFANSEAFKHLPLWSAYYDGDKDVDYASAPYGGWTLDNLIGEQYAGSIELAGVTVDRNSFRRDFVLPPEEDDMAYMLVLGRDPAEPGMIYVVYKDSAGHPLWKTHLKDFADMPKLGVTFPVVDMVELRSVGVLPTRHV